MTKKRVQKLITFSPQLYQMIESKANRVGLSFPEYIRILAVSDIKSEVESLPIVDEETERRVGRSLRDIEKGRYEEVDPKNNKKLNKVLGIK